MKILWQNVITLLAFVAYNYLCFAQDKKPSLIIGVLVGDEKTQSLIPLQSAIDKNNLIYDLINYAIKIQAISPNDNFQNNKIFCNMTSSQEDEGIIAVFSPENSETQSIIESITTDLEIPHIQINPRKSSIPNEPNSETLINFYPNSELFAQGLAVIVQNLGWNSFVILYENENGLIRLQEVLKLQHFDKNKRQNTIILRPLGPGPDYRSVLKDIKNSTETHILLDCETEHVIEILRQAKEVKLLQFYTNYFITSLDSHTLDFSVLNTKANITTIRIFNPESEDIKRIIKDWELTEYNHNNGKFMDLTPYMINTETVLMHDAINLFLESAYALHHTGAINTKPLNCAENEKSTDGYRITSFMKIKSPDSTLSGPIKFDKKGNRIDFTIYVVEGNKNNVIGIWSAIEPELLNSTRNDIERYKAMLASFQDDIIIVSSRIGEPYLRYRKPRYEGEVLEGNARYEGYSMDLITALSEVLNFTFEFRLTDDGNYGSYNPKTKSWNGLIKDILEHKAQLAICDLTITHSRREVVDFSMPFMTLGISILHKQPDAKDVNMFAFLDPFSVEVWIYTATLFLTVSIILYLVARMAPEDWENPHPCDENPEELENIWDLKNCFWLTMGSIMTQGCDILPKGISSRMASSMWWFFSLIMTSSYTANLAAFLTMERMEPSIDSAEALSKQTKIKYGTVKGGATQSFFREANYTTYQRMWTNMISNKPSVFEKTNGDGVKRVQTTKHGLYAFLMESSQIEYEMETKCDLKQVGSWLDSKGYGIAMPINSVLRTAINQAILTMQEEGKLNQLKTKWWKEMRNEKSCENSGSAPEAASSELALANVGGVFLVLGIGVAVAFLISILEFLWNVHNVSVEEHISYCQALKVEVLFALQIWVTKKKTNVQISESSSSHNGGDEKSVGYSIIQGASSFLNMSILNKTETPISSKEK